MRVARKSICSRRLKSNVKQILGVPSSSVSALCVLSVCVLPRRRGEVFKVSLSKLRNRGPWLGRETTDRNFLFDVRPVTACALNSISSGKNLPNICDGFLETLVNTKIFQSFRFSVSRLPISILGGLLNSRNLALCWTIANKCPVTVTVTVTVTATVTVTVTVTVTQDIPFGNGKF